MPERSLTLLNFVSETIISRTAGILSSPKNICSVLTSPTPSAPKATAKSCVFRVYQRLCVHWSCPVTGQPSCITVAKSPDTDTDVSLAILLYIYIACSAIERYKVALFEHNDSTDLKSFCLLVNYNRSAAACNTACAHASCNNGGVACHTTTWLSKYPEILFIPSISSGLVSRRTKDYRTNLCKLFSIISR